MSKRGIRLGLAAAVWFAALFRAGHDLWAATALFAWLTLLAVLFLWDRRRDSVKAPLALPLLLWAGAAALSLSRSFDVNTTLLEIRVWLFSVLFFFLLANSADDAAGREEFFAAAGWSIVPVALIAVWERASGTGDQATLINAGVLAGFALCWIFFFGRQALARRSALVPFAACLAALVAAGSWWAYVSLAVGLLFDHRARARRTPEAAVGALCAAAAVLALIVRAKLLASADADRLHYWLAALRMFARYPLTGVGLGGFQTAYPFFRGDAVGVQNTLFAHDFPLQILAETGLAGAGAALLAARGAARSLRTGAASDERGVWGATLAAVLCYGLTSIFFEYFLSKLLLMALLAALLGGGRFLEFRLRPLRAAGAAAGLLLVSVFWLRPLAASRLLESGKLSERSGDRTGAEKLDRDAVSLDPTLADGDWALYLLEKDRSASSRSPEDRRRADADLREAVRLKKSALFLSEAAGRDVAP